MGLVAMVLIGAEHAPIETQAPADPRAQVPLRAAQNLDRAGKPKCVAFYQQLVREFGGSDAADFAAGRIAALGQGPRSLRGDPAQADRRVPSTDPGRGLAGGQRSRPRRADGGDQLGFPRAGPAGVAQIGVPPR